MKGKTSIVVRREFLGTIKRPGWLGLLSLNVANTVAGSWAGRRRGKRNPWVVLGFFGLVVMAWINSQM